jgi:hypothetical protein
MAVLYSRWKVNRTKQEQKVNRSQSPNVAHFTLMVNVVPRTGAMPHVSAQRWPREMLVEMFARMK